MSDKLDELEARVDLAIKKAYRDGPDWMEVRASVEALKADRRKKMKPSTEDTFNGFAEAVTREAEDVAKAVSQEADEIAKTINAEAEKVSKKLRRFSSGLRSAFKAFTEDDKSP